MTIGIFYYLAILGHLRGPSENDETWRSRIGSANKNFTHESKSQAFGRSKPGFEGSIALSGLFCQPTVY